MFTHYEKNLNNQLNKVIKKKDSIVFFNTRNKSFINKKFKLKNYTIIETPYSYQQKRNAILIPNTCYLKVEKLL